VKDSPNKPAEQKNADADEIVGQMQHATELAHVKSQLRAEQPRLIEAEQSAAIAHLRSKMSAAVRAIKAGQFLTAVEILEG
jgi:hypothetical protein